MDNQLNLYQLVLSAKDALKCYFDYVARYNLLEEYPNGHFVVFDPRYAFNRNNPKCFHIGSPENAFREMRDYTEEYIKEITSTIHFYVHPDKYNKYEIAKEFKAQLKNMVMRAIDEDFKLDEWEDKKEVN